MAPTNTGTDAPPRPEDEVDDIMDDSKPLLAGSKSGFHTDYDIGTDLGSGSFSVVKAATHRETGNIVAVKCIRRASLPADEREALRDEVSILRELDHPNIIAMHDFYEEEQNFYLVMEVMEGGGECDAIILLPHFIWPLTISLTHHHTELFDRIVQKSYYNEKEARDLVKILLNSMQYLHVRNIVHRDLKPENLLLANKQDDSNIRLADFGFAKRVIKPLGGECDAIILLPHFIWPLTISLTHHHTELFDRIVQKSYYNEKEARDLVKILLNSMQYLHVRNIVHRDLKPENLLLANKQDDSNIRLADFGFAKRVIKPLKTQCGTPGYVAPEILRGDTYGLSVDMWSIGVITYILLGGYPPFHDDNQR